MAKNLFRKISVIALTAVGAASLGLGAAGCVRKSSASFDEPENAVIARLTPPDDGSLPTAHTCAENLAYIASVFDGQEQYHSYSYGVTGASIATQTTRTFRDYKDGVLLTTDFTHSSMIKSGSQTCTLKNDDGNYEVYFRTSDAPGANTLPTQATWSEEAPLIFNERSYHFTYGLLPTELFNYIVNEETIVDSEQITVNPDGTYTQNFTLDPVASTYYYQFGMKTRGGLSGYPEFKSITFSVTFDAGWKILSSYMHEVANVNKGIVVESISDFTTEYWYGGDNFDGGHHSYYESYYRKFLGDEKLEQGGSVDDKLVVDVTGVLSNGFSEILNGGDQFEISADLGKNHYAGYVFLSLDLDDPLASLALKLSLGKKLNNQNLYLEYGDGGLSAYYGNDFALTANLAEVKYAAEGFGEVIKRFETAIGKIIGNNADGSDAQNGASALTEEAEGGDPVSDLMNSMVLVAGEKQAVLTLNTDDLLGMGIGINARLVFAISGNEISFRGATVNDLSIGGEKLDLSLTLRTTTAPEISRNPSETGADLADYVADVRSLLGADLFKVGLTLDGTDDAVKIKALKGLNAKINAYADIDGLTVGADADVSYEFNGAKISAKLAVWYGYDPAQNNYGEAIVNLTELNGAPYDVILKCDIKQVADAISSAVTLAGADLGGAADGLVQIINGALSADLSKLLTEVYADKAQIKIGVSVDAVLKMLNLDLGMKFGNCTLKYQRGEGQYGGIFSANLPALGFTLSVEGAQGGVEKPDAENALDVWYVLEDIKEIAEADLLHAELVLDGSADGVTISQLDGVYANVNAYFTTENVTVSASAEVSYTYNNNTVSAKVSAYYGADEVALSIDELNGVALNAGVTCNITEITQAVENLLKYAGLSVTPFDGLSDSLDLAGVITNILNADFKKLLPVLGTTADGMAIGANLDEALSLVGVKTSLKLGTVNLLYSHTAEDVLSASVPALGLKLGLNCAQDTIVKPETAGYLDLTDLVKTVEQAWKNVDGIIKGEALSFNIEKKDTYLYLDGILVQIWGEGEISWKKGSESVALDLGFGIKDGEKPSDDASLKLIYNKNADGDTPMVRVALNDVGLDIYREDIDDTVNGFNAIYEKIKPLIGGTASAASLQADGENLPDGNGENATAKDRLFGLIFGVLANDNWVEVLNDFTLTCDGKSVALAYLQDNSVKITVEKEGDINLCYGGKTDGGFRLGGNLTVSPVTGTLVTALNEKIESECTVSSTRKKGSAEFIRLAYDFLFDAINSISVENILGSSTYEVKFKLDGTVTGVKELEDVYIDVQLYYTGAGNDHGRLAEINLDVNVKGVVINLNVICEYKGNQVYFYMNLKQVMDVTLPDLKFVATQDSLYETLKVLFDTVNDTDIIDFAGKMLGLNTTPAAPSKAPSESNGGTNAKVDDATINKVCDLVEKLLNFNFKDTFVATEQDGVINATLHIDSVLKQLGISGGEQLQNIDFEINRNTHFMNTSGKVPVTDADGNAKEVTWIHLSSERADRRSYESFFPAQYVSIEFLPDMIKDLVNFAADGNNEIYDKFTFSGTVKANVDIKITQINLNVDVRSFTLALDKEEGISFSGVLHFNKVSVLSLVTIPNTTVGITYKNGLLTLAKGVTTATPEYKVMTFDYFLDHLLVKNDCVLQWWLDIDGWNNVFNILNMSVVKNLMGGELKITSGIENTEDVYLYDRTAQSTAQDIYMRDFVEAIRVVIGGKTKSNYVSEAKYANRMDEVESNLKIAGQDYYGFSINAGKVTGGIFDGLYGALLRTGQKGVTGVKAYGSIKNELVKLEVDLGYNEGLTEEYALGGTDAMTDTKCAPDFYTPATAIADKLKVQYDFKYYKEREKEATDECFGCLTVSEKENYSCGVAYSYPRHKLNLTVVGLDGKEEIISVKQGSKVYLYDNEYPAYTDDSKQFRLLYSLTEGKVGGTSFEMNAAETVYAVKVKAVTVRFLKLDGTEYGEGVPDEYYTFVGDDMPLSATGMEAVDGPYYANGKKVAAGEKVPDGSASISLYGTFARTLVTVDGIRYQFANGGYTVVGRAASGFNEKYVTETIVDQDGNSVTRKGETIYLQSHIDGYPVTAIGEKAFANTELDSESGNVGKPINGIVVPATVTNVGKNAFLDNVGMEYAVFLADEVKFEGEDGSSKTMPFYGCSRSYKDNEIDGKKQNEVTDLVVYCNKITASGGDWNHFRYVYNGWWFNFKIGSNGGRVVSTNWEYAKVVIENQTEYGVEELVKANLADGLREGVNNAQTAQNNILEAINAESAVKGFIDKYAVTVTYGKDSYGYAVYTVKVTVGDVKHFVAVNRNANAKIEVTGEGVVEYNGAIYASGEITVECKDIKSGYKFTDFTVNGAVYGENPAIVAVTGVTEISVNLKANLYAVNLVSAIDCNYDGGALTANAVKALSLAEVGGKITLSAPAAEGYTFLGWAREIGGSLQFAEASFAPENGVTFYAIWGHSKVGSAFTTSVATAGNALPAVSGGLNKWFDGSWNEVTQISKENTVVYTRSVYNFNYGISGNVVRMYITDTLKNVNKKLTNSYSSSFETLEGQSVSVVKTEGKKVVVSVDGQIKTTLTLSKYLANNYDFKSDEGSLTGGKFEVESVNEDCNLSLKY